MTELRIPPDTRVPSRLRSEAIFLPQLTVACFPLKLCVQFNAFMVCFLPPSPTPGKSVHSPYLAALHDFCPDNFPFLFRAPFFSPYPAPRSNFLPLPL